MLFLVSAEKAEESHVIGNFKNIPALWSSLALKVGYPSFGEGMISWSIPETLKTLGVCPQIDCGKGQPAASRTIQAIQLLLGKNHQLNASVRQ